MSSFILQGFLLHVSAKDACALRTFFGNSVWATAYRGGRFWSGNESYNICVSLFPVGERILEEDLLKLDGR